MKTATRTLIPREKTNEFLAGALMDFLDRDAGPAGQQWRASLAQMDAANPEEPDASEAPARQRRSA